MVREGIAWYDSLREELFGSQTPRAIFSDYVFVVVGIEERNGLRKHSLIITTKIDNKYHPPKSTNIYPIRKIINRRKGEKWYETKIRVGTSVTVKVGETDKNIREEKNKRDEEGAYLDCIISHTYLPSSSFLTFSGWCLYYTWRIYGELPLMSPQKLPYTYWKFCSIYPSRTTFPPSSY